MFSPIVELKIRARLRLNASRTINPSSAKRDAALNQKKSIRSANLTLSKALDICSREAGFSHWNQARQVLGGEAQADDDMGAFWYEDELGDIANSWFDTYIEAKMYLQSRPDCFLLPYKKRYFVAGLPLIARLGLGDAPDHWKNLANDLVAGYGSSSWLALCALRLNVTRGKPLHLDQSYDAGKQTSGDFERRVLHTFIENGRLKKIPQMRKKRLVILQWLVQQLTLKQRYQEKEINTFLLQFHEDYATLRREFIAAKLMWREEGFYWRKE
jgi:hypothetical protein